MQRSLSAAEQGACLGKQALGTGMSGGRSFPHGGFLHMGGFTLPSRQLAIQCMSHAQSMTMPCTGKQGTRPGRLPP